MTFNLRRLFAMALAFLSLPAFSAHAQVTLGDYQRAEKFLPGNVRHLYTTGEVMAHWIEKSDRF